MAIDYWVELDWDTGEIIKSLTALAFIHLTKLEDVEREIHEAKKNGLKVLLQIYPEYKIKGKEPWFDTHRIELQHGPFENQEDFLENATEFVINVANFTEENDVEMFSPWCEMNVFIDWNHTRDWTVDIVPKIRKVYHGLLLTLKGEITWDKYRIGPEGDLALWDFSGYDYIGADVFDNDYRFDPNYAEASRDYEHYRWYVGKLIGFLKQLKETYGSKGIVLGSEIGLPEQFFSQELRRGVRPQDFMNRVCTILFEESLGKVDGYFFFPCRGFQATVLGNMYFADASDLLRQYYST